MTRGKPLSFNRDEVLEKAMDLFWAKGYGKTGMTELLDHMGIQRQSFYNTFGSKEEVFLEAVRLYSQATYADIAAILSQDKHPMENIRELFDMWEQLAETKQGCGCLMANSIAEFGLSQESVSEILKEQVDQLYDLFYRAFSQAIENGYLPASKDPKALAMSYVTMAQGMALLSKMGFGRGMLDDVLKISEDLLT